jgi:hypothetical protein
MSTTASSEPQALAAEQQCEVWMRLRPASWDGPPPRYAYDPCILTATRTVELACEEHGYRVAHVCESHWYEMRRNEPFVCRYCRKRLMLAAR